MSRAIGIKELIPAKENHGPNHPFCDTPDRLLKKHGNHDNEQIIIAYSTLHGAS